ncbi:DUF1826 domain-containing protein [Bermanella marisrubri]|uniref:Succinylglutamate desuccinylase n=1 Tax=Bermanella marisrubri TaxID=207949 RepID=Q1N3U5_9GAMM|nr:DUF1826 domain-containing protein [Bermanella marisrubri]EAT12779.1 hypothetical protein RED65_11939 [Oceanobacter sp. RED65] [Bermanella marisrubri]QIZ83106.1 DUF1826 domain-containing protein [Bermanella marisrubri]
MIPAPSSTSEPVIAAPPGAAIGTEPDVFTEIYQEHTNIAILQRDLSAEIATAATNLLSSKASSSNALIATPDNAIDVLSDEFGISDTALALFQDVADLVDMFCCLLGTEQAGIRLTKIDRAMCPRFHVDKVPCRLVTTYFGPGSEWVEHKNVNREKLGAGNGGLPDEESGLLTDLNHIQKLNGGDAALLKGERWIGNEGSGLVHRSPKVPQHTQRLLLTLDMVQ